MFLILELLWDNFDILRQPLTNMRQRSADLQSVTMMSSGTTQNSMSRIFMTCHPWVWWHFCPVSVPAASWTAYSSSCVGANKILMLKSNQKPQQRFRTIEKSGINPVLSENERLKANTSGWWLSQTVGGCLKSSGVVSQSSKNWKFMIWSFQNIKKFAKRPGSLRERWIQRHPQKP